jgi:hypothetical protein
MRSRLRVEADWKRTSGLEGARQESSGVLNEAEKERIAHVMEWARFGVMGRLIRNDRAAAGIANDIEGSILILIAKESGIGARTVLRFD